MPTKQQSDKGTLINTVGLLFTAIVANANGAKSILKSYLQKKILFIEDSKNLKHPILKLWIRIFDTKVIFFLKKLEIGFFERNKQSFLDLFLVYFDF